MNKTHRVMNGQYGPGDNGEVRVSRIFRFEESLGWRLKQICG